MAACLTITFTENEERWIATETGIGDIRPERRWSFQNHRLNGRLRVVQFYASGLDEALGRIRKGV